MPGEGGFFSTCAQAVHTLGKLVPKITKNQFSYHVGKVLLSGLLQRGTNIEQNIGACIQDKTLDSGVQEAR